MRGDRPELYATFWTISGDTTPGLSTEVSPYDFRRRVEAAREAGYRGLGLSISDYIALRERIGVPAMKAILADNGLPLIEFESLFDWFATGERREKSDAARREFLRAADEFGARHIKVVADFIDTRDDAWPMEHIAGEFRKLCDEAARVGANVVLELLPFSNIKTPAQGRALVETAGAGNGGLNIDIWHIVRGNIPFAEVAALPRAVIKWVEICDADAAMAGTLYEDTVHNRRLPGEGDFDLLGFINAVRAAGYQGGYGVEIISKEQRRREPEEAARLAFDMAMREFERARETPRQSKEKMR
jgi:sugar phosphate isomerase/epimerase